MVRKIIPAAVLLLAGCGIQNATPLPGTEVWEMTVNGQGRTLLVHPPESNGGALPVLLVFHGGYGTASGAEEKYSISELADREGIIAVYPQGLQRHWNDGRVDPGDVSDVLFVEAVIDSLSRRYTLDTDRIYATGMSNGGIFCHFLAEKLPGVLAGIAPVCGGVADPGYQWFSPDSPLDVCIIQGVEDPLVPWDGGEIGGRRTPGSVLPADEAVRIWRGVNSCTGDAAVTEMRNTVPEDGCTETMFLYTGVRDVLLVRIDGGGHGWPGGGQYLSGNLIGRVCRDFNAAEFIWKFFTEAMERKAHEGTERETGGGGRS